MASEIEDKKQRAYANRRALMDLGMGLIYAAVGVFLIVSTLLGKGLELFGSTFCYLFGALCLIYGGFRIYRGIKKNYYR